MGKATNPRQTGNRKGGGRPRQGGDRYPSGKLKKQGPNALVVERRRQICADVTMASCPLDVAFANGWISKAEYHAGQTYIEVHRAACLGSPGGSSQADLSAPDPVDVRRVSWSEMSDEEIGRIWDRVMRGATGGFATEAAERRMVEAMIRYKAMNADMTPEQRSEVDSICIRESWPQWIIQRVNGRTGTSWERKYDLLVAGLRAIRGALAKPRPANDDAALRPSAAPANDPAGPKLIERTIYVDDEGRQVLEVERVTRRPAA